MTVTLGIQQQLSDQTNVVVASVLLNSDQILANPLSTLVEPVYFNQIYTTLQISPNQYQIGQITLGQVPVPFAGIYTYQFAIRFVQNGTPVTSQQFLGPQGPPGIPGKAGAPGIGSEGPPGPTGPQGATGVMGSTGPSAGPVGATGVQGATGPQGATGVRGAPGIQGFTGAQGIPGPTGPRGTTGPTGAQGIPGIFGLQGPTGPLGATGPFGTINQETSPDSFTSYWWKLDEGVTSSIFANSGQASGGNLTLASGITLGDLGAQPTVGNSMLRSGRTGILTGAVDFFQDTVIGNAARIVSSGALSISNTQLSIHGWIRLHSQQPGSQWGRIFSIWYKPAGNSPSSAADAFSLNINASSANLYVQGNVGGSEGTNLETPITTDDALPIFQWAHVGVTFSGNGTFSPGNGTVIIYLNGNVVINDISWYGHIDLAGGGPFSLGGTTVSFSGINGELDDWRLESGVVRSASYMRALFQAGKPC